MRDGQYSVFRRCCPRVEVFVTSPCTLGYQTLVLVAQQLLRRLKLEDQLQSVTADPQPEEPPEDAWIGDSQQGKRPSRWQTISQQGLQPGNLVKLDALKDREAQLESLERATASVPEVREGEQHGISHGF
jgi:hypothetical protein